MAALLFLYANVAHSQKRHHYRYHSWRNDYHQLKDIYTIKPYLNELGIGPEDRIIFLYDMCLTPMYLMDRPGWNFNRDWDEHTEIDRYSDSVSLARMVDFDAKYIIIQDITEMMKRSAFHPYLNHLVGKYNNTLIFKIHDSLNNFNIYEEARIVSGIVCDFEGRQLPDGYVLCSDSAHRAGARHVLYSGLSRSGRHSIKLNRDFIYCADIVHAANPLDEIEATMYYYPKESYPNIVISSNNNTLRHDHTLYSDADEGWTKAVSRVIIPPDINNDSILVFVWNSRNADSIIVDDILVKRSVKFEILKPEAK